MPRLRGNRVAAGDAEDEDVDPGLQDAWITYRHYVLGVNDGDLPTAYAQLVAGEQGYQEFVDGVATSEISDFSLRRFEMEDGHPLLDIDFTSHQDAERGPSSRPDETCTTWHLRYRFDESDGVWLIGSARAIPGEDQNQPCEEFIGE